MDKSFKVPKLMSKERLQMISLNGNEYKNIHKRILESLIKPQQSEKLFTFINCWLINNRVVEHLYINRRHSMRKENPHLAESIGFIYLKSKKELFLLAKEGRICIGNVKDSCLGTGSLGVSICQHADIYHPGHYNIGIPKTGYLVLVKYLKGKINFVQFDKTPMEPQPYYDCHMVKSSHATEKNCNISKAFHMTQVFLYEYSEDGDILNFPTQILPFAALEFQWYGSYIYRISFPSSSKPKLVEHTNDKRLNIESETHSIKSTTENKRTSRFQVIDNSIHKQDSTFTLPCQLVFDNNQNKNLPELKIISTVYMYMTNPVVFPHLYVHQWKISDIIEISEFEKELKLFQFHLQDKITRSQTDLLDPLSHDLIISTNSPTVLTLSENNLNEPFLLSNDTTIPKFATYLRIVPDASKESKHCAFKLIDHFNNSKTIARVSLGATNDQYRTILFIFPDGKFSQKLGLPSIKTSTYYFHGLLLHFQHPEFSLCNLNEELFEEKSIYFTALSLSRKQSVLVRLNGKKSIIDINLLKQTCIDQAVIQKEMFSCILKPTNNKQSLRYPDMSFDRQLDIPLNENTINKSLSISVDKSTIAKNSDKVEPEKIQQKNIVTPATTTKRRLTKKNLKKYNKKQKLSELKDMLYSIYKSPANETEIVLPNENISIEIDSDSLSGSSTSYDFQSNIEIDYNDLVPIRKMIPFDDSNNGCFNELVFVDEYSANIGQSSRLMHFNTQPNYVRTPSTFQKMWFMDRFIFRKVKHLPGISVYVG